MVTFTGNGGRYGPGDILYATYLGLKQGEEVRAVALDAQGNTYLSGVIDSGDPDQGTEAAVVKLSADGELVYSVVFGGLGADEANGIDADGEGNAYVSGSFTNQFGTINGFVTKLNANGERFLWRRNSPGSPTPDSFEASFGTLRYHAGRHQVYYTGYFTVGIPIPGLTVRAGGVGRLNAADGFGTSTFTGVTLLPPNHGDTIGTGIGVDQTGNAYVAIHHTRLNVGDTSWAVLKFRENSGRLDLDWDRTYLGEGIGVPWALAADASGNSYAVGFVVRPDGRTVFQEMKHGPTGQLIYRFTSPIIDSSTYIEGRSIAIDAQGRSYVTGLHFTDNGDADVFLTRVTPRQSGGNWEFDFDTLTFGGSGADAGLALAARFAPPGNPSYAIVVGVTDSDTDFPITDDALQPTYGGGLSDGFVARTRLPGA